MGSKSPRAGWRLTDRGLAVVTVLIGVVVVAAVAVVALTAWQVTGDGFVPAGSSVAVQR